MTFFQEPRPYLYVRTVVLIGALAWLFFTCSDGFDPFRSLGLDGKAELILQKTVLDSAKLFLLAKAASGAIAFLKNMAVEAGVVIAGVSINPASFVEPAYSLVDQFAEVMLFIGAAAQIALLLPFTAWFTAVLVPAGLLLLSLGWMLRPMHPPASSSLGRVGSTILLLGLLLRLGVPGTIVAAHKIGHISLGDKSIPLSVAMRDEKSNVDKPAILKKLTSTSELYKELFRELEIEEKTLSKIHAQALGEAISFGLKAQGGPGAPPTAHAEERQGLGPIYRKLVDISNLIDPSYAATVFAQRTHATFAALHGKKEEEKGWLTAFKATVKERIDDVALRLLTVVSIFLLHVLVIPLALIFGFYKAINSLLGIDLPGFPSLPKKGA